MKMASKAALLGAVMVVTGCASVQVKHPQIDQVKTVAIIGYTETLDLSDSSDANTSTGFGAIANISKGAANADEEMNRRKSELEATYVMASAALNEGGGWAVTARDAVEGNPDYANFAAATNSPYMARLPKLAAFEATDRMDPGQRAALAKALGVDAVAFVRLRTVVGKISGVSIGGMGKTEKHLKGIVTVKLFDLTTPDPIWSDLYAEGPASEIGIARTMGIDSDENETAAVLEAAKGAFATMNVRFKTAMTKPADK